MEDFENQAAVLGSTLRVREPPLCPELKLWLLGDDVDLNRRVSELLSIDRAPYWAFCWGSGQALARYVLDHPALVRGKQVVDFGAGCGIAALAAAKAGARTVVAVDIDPHARAACLANARLNALSLRAEATPPAACEVLLASDVLYEPGNREHLLEALERGATVLVGDPLRAEHPRLAAEPVARFDVRTLPDVDPPQRTAVVYRLEPSTQ